MRKFITTLTFLLTALAVYSLPVRAQSVSKAFTLTLTPTQTTVSGDFPNVGQSAHQVYACLSGMSGNSQATIELDASSDGTNYFAISSPLTLKYNAVTRPPQGYCGTITANGYYPAFQLVVSDVQGTGAYQLTGVYSGSIGSNPIAGESRSASAAIKVSQSPVQASYFNSDLKSTAQTIVTAPTAPASQGVYIYGVMAYNPNASVVYVLVNESGGVDVEFAVPATSSVNISLPAPAYEPNTASTSCSTLPAGGSDPATGCVVDVLYTLAPGANSNVTATGTVNQTDNSPGNTPY